tara:strand:- start:180 stop:353 length:174 start_codon:yes stop_codon:yes gene_type:complete
MNKSEIDKKTKININYLKVAEFILDSADSKDELLWLLKQKYNNEELLEVYSDVINNK